VQIIVHKFFKKINLLIGIVITPIGMTEIQLDSPSRPDLPVRIAEVFMEILA
jgi:hypothetical protein